MEKEMATHSSILAWKSLGQRNLVGYSPWGHKESDTTERLHFHFQEINKCIYIAKKKKREREAKESPPVQPLPLPLKHHFPCSFEDSGQHISINLDSLPAGHVIGCFKEFQRR